MGEKPKLQPYEFKTELYDRIIFGTPVWASTFAPSLRTVSISKIQLAKTRERNSIFDTQTCLYVHNPMS